MYNFLTFSEREPGDGEAYDDFEDEEDDMIDGMEDDELEGGDDGEFFSFIRVTVVSLTIILAAICCHLIF